MHILCTRLAILPDVLHAIRSRNSVKVRISFAAGMAALMARARISNICAHSNNLAYYYAHSTPALPSWRLAWQGCSQAPAPCGLCLPLTRPCQNTSLLSAMSTLTRCRSCHLQMVSAASVSWWGCCRTCMRNQTLALAVYRRSCA